MRRRLLVPLLVTAGLAAVAGACSSGPERVTTTSTSAAPPTSTTLPEPTSTSQPAPSSSAPASTRPGTASGVLVRAVVAGTFASARVIQLAAPVDGYSEIAVSSSTTYRTASGQALSLGDIQPGATIQVRGQKGSGGALLASEVVVVG